MSHSTAAFVVICIVAGILPDYIALGKSRLLLNTFTRLNESLFKIFLLIIVDIFLSLIISLSSILFCYTLMTKSSIFGMVDEMDSYLTEDGMALLTTVPILSVSLFCSTLFTSVWIALIGMSSGIVRIASPLQRLTLWFFDVQRHPLQAIGVVSAGLVMGGAGILTLARLVIVLTVSGVTSDPAKKQAAMTEANRTYYAFFDVGSSTLTDRSRQIVGEAARASHQQKVRFNVIGNTDTSEGTYEQMHLLSMRRAKAVSDELTRRGIPIQVINTGGVGIEHLMVITGLNVREPQNRRVEIVISEP